MAKRDQYIVILEFSNASSESLRETLRKQGFATQICGSINEAVELLARYNNTFLLVNCGKDQKGGLAAIKSLLSEKELHDSPVLVLGAEVHLFEGLLTRTFEAAVALPAPFTNADVVGAIDYLSKIQQQKAGLAEPVQVSSGEEEIVKETPAPPQRPQPTDERVPDLIFNQFFALNILNRHLGGERYIRASTPEKIQNPEYFPTNSYHLTNIITKILRRAGNWGANHLHRSAFLAYSVTSMLAIDDDARRAGKAAAFLFASVLVDEKRDYLRTEYLLRGDGQLRLDIAGYIKRSADLVGADAKLTLEAVLIQRIADLISGKAPIKNDTESILASAIAAADAVGRVCWHSGVWDAHAAYRYMRAVKSGQANEYHPAVLCCILKTIAEGVLATGKNFFLGWKKTKNAALQQAAKAAAEREVAEHERKVPIAHLAPGMKLSRPLVAFDGKEVLAADLILDQDLIWRIWQLSAIRPLNAPLVVEDD